MTLPNDENMDEEQKIVNDFVDFFVHATQAEIVGNLFVSGMEAKEIATRTKLDYDFVCRCNPYKDKN
jgi:hypothetical protein